MVPFDSPRFAFLVRSHRLAGAVLDLLIEQVNEQREQHAVHNPKPNQ